MNKPDTQMSAAVHRDPIFIDGMSREEVVDRLSPRISAMARRLMARLPQGASIELGDLINSGALGLLDAINRYDPNRDVRFSTFADFRIRGAMLDVLRGLDPKSRQGRTTTNRLAEAIRKLQHRLGRAPEAEEVAAQLDITVEEYWHMVKEGQGVLIVSFDAQPSNGARPLSDVLTGADDATAEERVALREAIGDMRRAMEKVLTPRQRTVLVLYYQRHLTLKEIGAVIEVTESRVSQIHTEACLRLRGHLSAYASQRPSMGDGWARGSRACEA